MRIVSRNIKGQRGSWFAKLNNCEHEDYGFEKVGFPIMWADEYDGKTQILETSWFKFSLESEKPKAFKFFNFYKNKQGKKAVIALAKAKDTNAETRSIASMQGLYEVEVLKAYPEIKLKFINRLTKE